ncbi:MAG TPA: response regulator [Ramlibacter sp.]|nr:response regulator [Ramlibacter sp.]
MAQRIFIKVVGFAEEERHALNTVFRLSEQCRTMYQLWTPEAPEAPRAALLDAGSHEARLEAESPSARGACILWVGDHPPSSATRTFSRPLAWGEVIESLDALFTANAEELDLDLAVGEDSVMSQKLALIVSSNRERRLYLRARLALAKLTFADEADSGARALELARGRKYDVAVVDGGLPDTDPWRLMRALRDGPNAVAHLALAGGLGMGERLRARLAGAYALDHPPQPAQLKEWLSRI